MGLIPHRCQGRTTALSPDLHRAAVSAGVALGRGDAASQDEIDRLVEEWTPALRPEIGAAHETFAIVRPDGATTGVVGPRWLFHLLGLRHRAIEIALATPAGLIILQRRSSQKDQWPGALDMAVAGHVVETEGAVAADFLGAAWKEAAEELGLREDMAATLLVEGTLTQVGCPYFCLERNYGQSPPFIDAEVRQIFAATLSGEGLARLSFPDGEVDGLILVTPDTAWQELRGANIASGMRYSLPRYLDWLERRRNGASQPPR